MNIVGIDISINSTAVYIYNSNSNNKHILSFTNKSDKNMYIKELEKYNVDFYFSTKPIDSNNYSINEIIKLNYYEELSNMVVAKIMTLINKEEHTEIAIEGYSFSKNTSSILDIVSLSTLIRIKLIKNIKNLHIEIISPASLKKKSCGLVYGYDKKGNTKNNEGISGGKFKKPEMFKAMIEGNINTPILDFLKSNLDLLNRSKIPNPIEDINDSIFACLVRASEVNVKYE